MTRIGRARLCLMVAAWLVGGRPASAQAPDAQAQHDAAPPAPVVARLFGSVQWGTFEEDAETRSSFTLGQFSLFMTAPLGDRFSVLAEVALEGGLDNEVVADLERLQLTYRLNDAFALTAGRYHAGIGFYNATFHHGAYFETPIGRPRVFAFEDEGGILPIHDIGVSARGGVPGTGGALQYVVETGNGRQWAAAEAHVERDRNAAKALNAALSYRPARWRGFEAGASLYRDTIPATGTAIRYGIRAAFVTYRTPVIELMGEWLHLVHQVPGARRFANHAGYAQASRGFGRWRPYYRYDRLAIDAATPLVGFAGSYRAHIAGLRLDPSQWVGLKAQYERTREGGREDLDAVRTELVFVF